MTRPTDFRVGDIVRVTRSVIPANVGKLCLVIRVHAEAMAGSSTEIKCLLSTDLWGSYIPRGCCHDVKPFPPDKLELVERDGKLYDLG